EILDAEFVEMGELDRNAAEIVPHAGEDFFDLSVGFFGKGGAQILPAEAVFLEKRADLAHQGAGEIRRALAIHAFDGAHQPDRERADRRVEQDFAAPADHQNMTMILPNTCRLSSRLRPRSNSASATSVSITGKRPDAILARLSPMLRIEQPNEPKMRYCCK